MYRIVPYKQTSGSAKLLAVKLTELSGVQMVSGPPSFDYRNVLWGSSGTNMATMQPTAGINIAKNKLNTFRALKTANVSIPDFTTEKATAEGWVRAGTTVLARTKLNASEGRGIVICKELPLPEAPLYVKLVKKKKEFRVHVFNGQVIALQEKRRRNGVRQANGQLIDGTIRNIGNDWVFCRNNIVEPTGLRDIGIAAVNACGLMFGAVDVIWNKYHNRLYALEVNTAPGLCESTATSYARALLALPNYGWQARQPAA